MFKALGLSIAILLMGVSVPAAIETAHLSTARGAIVDVIVNVPEHVDGKVPAVVIAPGSGYHMDLPIVKQLAESLAARGVIAYRFNWNYFSQDPHHGEPSNNLVNEVQDMQTVVAFAKQDSRADTTRVSIGGKSLGSKVSYRLFAEDASLKALVLMTPVCTSSYDDNDQPLPSPINVAAQNYVGLNSQTRPIVMVLGNNDPLCSLPMLYDFLKDSTHGNVSVNVIGGNHSWNVTDGTDPSSVARNSQNIAHGVEIVAHWIDLLR